MPSAAAMKAVSRFGRAGAGGAAAPDVSRLGSDASADGEGGPRPLPTADANKIKVALDAKTGVHGGWLYKKGGGSSLTGRRSWNKRWFTLDLQSVRDDEADTYRLRYFKVSGLGSRELKGQLGLEGCTISQVARSEAQQAGKGARAAFQLKGARATGGDMELYADSEDERAAWVDSIRYLIEISNRRALVRENNARRAAGLAPIDNLLADKAPTVEAPTDKIDPTLLDLGHDAAKEHTYATYDEDALERDAQVARQATDGSADGDLCGLRFELAAHEIPEAGSDARADLDSRFCADIASAVGEVESGEVRVRSIEPVPGMDGFALALFELIPRLEQDSPEDDGADVEPGEDRFARRKQALDALHRALQDPSSSLYRGQLTRTADPAFAGSLRGCARVDGAEDVRVVGLVSAVPRVQAILEKYQDLPAPPVGSVVVSHFTIRLARDGKKASKPLKVLNPKFWRSRHCIVHRHEVVAALGLGNTVHERWLKPIGLVPCDVPEHLATPVVFKADKYADGLPVIRAGMLKPGHKYEVKFEDSRSAVLEGLDAETRLKIQEAFDGFDTNGDGEISVEEVQAGCRRRTDQNKAAIDAQYQDALDAAQGDEVAIARADATRAMHYQRLEEAERRMIDMLLSADTDGDGGLTKMEFALAEAWWLSSTMNPSRAGLF